MNMITPSFGTVTLRPAFTQWFTDKCGWIGVNIIGYCLYADSVIPMFWLLLMIAMSAHLLYMLLYLRLMQFTGTVCKDIVTPTDKKGNQYLRFSAYSTDKVGENFYSVFVRFVRFSVPVESFITPKGKIEAKGDLRISTFNGNIDLQCKISEIKPWDKTPF